MFEASPLAIIKDFKITSDLLKIKTTNTQKGRNLFVRDQGSENNSGMY